MKFDLSRSNTISYEEPKYEDYDVQNIPWLTIEEFSVEKAERKINEFIKVFKHICFQVMNIVLKSVFLFHTIDLSHNIILCQFEFISIFIRHGSSKTAGYHVWITLVKMSTNMTYDIVSECDGVYQQDENQFQELQLLCISHLKYPRSNQRSAMATAFIFQYSI